VLVHDNASSDGTPEAIRAEFPAVEVEVAEGNLGFAIGVNRLVARSDAEWFLTLNSDAWLEPGALGHMLAAGLQRSQVAAVAPRIEGAEGHLEHTTQPFPTPAFARRLATPGYTRFWPRRAEANLMPGAWAHDRSRTVDWAVGAAWLMRRAALDEIGGLDERLFMYGEDLDWCWRAHEHGWSIWFDAEAKVRHLRNASGEKRFGETRDAIAFHNSYEVARWHQGRLKTTVTRAGHLAWAAESLLRSRPGSAEWAHWRAYIRSHRAAAKLGSTGAPD
jgi:hypothetical protein